MAFDIRNLSEVRALGSNRWHWNYYTADTLATVLGANYFSTVNGLSRLHLGDVLDIVAASGASSQQVTVSSVAGSSITLLQSSAGAATDGTAQAAAVAAQVTADAAMPKAGGTFTGTVVVPDATLATQAVNLGQAQTLAAGRWSISSFAGATNEAKLIAALAAGVREVIIPANLSVAISDTITVPAGVDLWMDPGSELLYGGTQDRPALTIGSAATLIYKARLRLNVRSSSLSDWSDEGYIGVLIINHRESDIFLDHAEGFGVGVKLLGDASGFNYNKVYIGRLLNNKVALRLSNKSAGAASINQNTFFGGSFAVGSSVNQGVDRFGVDITSDDGLYVNNNNNQFFNPSFELSGTTCTGGFDGYPVRIVHGQKNKFIGARSELSTKTGYVLDCQNLANDNEFDVLYHESSIPSILKQTGTRGNNTVRSHDTREVSRLISRHSVPAIAQHFVPYDGTNTFVRGHFFLTSSNATTYRQQTSLVLGADYLEIPSTRMLCVSFAVSSCDRIILKRRCTTSFGGRVGFKFLDSSDVLIDGTGTSIASSASGTISWNTTAGGCFRTGTDTVSDLILDIPTPTSVARVDILFMGGTAAMRLQSYEAAFISSGGKSATVTKRIPYGPVAEDHLIATAAPASGTWLAGQWVRNAVPTSGQPTGWGYSGSAWITGPNYA